MKKNLIMLIAGSALVMTAANAQESQNTNATKVKTSEVAPAVKPQEDIDQEITNAKLRAELGSKSKWSVKTSFSYSGGSLERPGDRIRPNYRAGADAPALTALGGSIGVKYSISKATSLSLSTGISVTNPFHGDLGQADFEDPRDSRESVKRTEISTPNLSITRAYKVGGLQMITSADYSHFTDSESVNKMSQIGAVGFDHTVLADLGESSWSAGMAFSLNKYLYSSGIVSADLAAQGARQTDFAYGLYPFAEYAFNDRFSFRTVFGYFEGRQYRDTDDKARITSPAPYQSMGLGISVNRDIYLYPNVQFTPLDIRSNRTNVALSATINMF